MIAPRTDREVFSRQTRAAQIACRVETFGQLAEGGGKAVVCGTVFVILAVLAIGCTKSDTGTVTSTGRGPDGFEVDVVRQGGFKSRELKILYPLDGGLFPPEIVAPTFRWEGGDEACDAWLIEFRFQDGTIMDFRSSSVEWTPPDEAWETIKSHSQESLVTVAVVGVNEASEDEILSRASISISTSKDEVGAPLFYREVNLPFIDAVKDPTRIRWRFGAISSKEQPPVVLEKLPVCGNCHSFSADGKMMGMDVDYANDRGSYAVCPVTGEIVLDREKIITWNDYRKEDGEGTFGFLSRVSPDGRYVVSTVKDCSVFVAKDDLAFSQLFFPIKGILVYFDRETREFHPLPGADDPQFVQSNAAWSPDGEHLVYARSPVHQLENAGDRKGVLLTREDCEEFLEEGKTFLFDLYRIPFNGGRGGDAEPLEGASCNGMSNYFPKYSPDGKWIVFCKAKSYMLLQPDSELYIIPAEGGRARRLGCNTWRMNSWHSWSPNGKWLVFSSKAYSAYTQLFLTHIDEQGRSSVPVLLSRFTGPDRAANIPEFVNAEADAIQSISEAFVDDHSYYRAAREYFLFGDGTGSAPLLRKSLELNPDNTGSRVALANVLSREGRIEEARSHLLKVLESEPSHADAHHGLGVLFQKEGRLEAAAEQCREAIASRPDHYGALTSLGLILLDSGKPEESVEPLLAAIHLQPEDAFTNYLCGHAFHRQFKLEEAAAHYRRAIECDAEYVAALLGLASIHMINGHPDLYDVNKAIALAERACEIREYKDAASLEILAGMYVVGGRLDEAVSTTRRALDIARRDRNQDLVERLQKNLDLYEEARRMR